MQRNSSRGSFSRRRPSAEQLGLKSLVRPSPGLDLRHVFAVLADIKLVTFHGRPVALRCRPGLACQARDSSNRIQRKAIPVEPVEHDHVEGRGRRSFLLIPVHVDVLVVVPPIGEAVDHRGIAVIGEDDRAIEAE